MKVLFMGTPAFAVPSLEAIIDSGRHEVVGVVTQPDRAIKRGRIEPCAVKAYASERGITVFQPEKIRDCTDELKSFGADIAVTAAYGQILTQGVLDSFPLGVINVHASLLPKYRGASPIYSAILAGETETGVTIMRTELGLDTGDMLAVVKTEIGENECATELTARLATLGAELLVETLDDFSALEPVKQDDSAATKCKTVKKDEQYIDFGRCAREVTLQIRALADEPCAKTVIAGEVYKVYGAMECVGMSGAPGEILRASGKLIIACGGGAVEITEIQAPGKRRLPASMFLNGRKLPVGDVCGKP